MTCVVAAGVVGTEPARQHDGVQRRSVLGQRVRDQLETGTRLDRPTTEGHHRDVVAVPAPPGCGQAGAGGGEDVERTHQVEGLHALEAQDHHGPRHALSVGDDADGVHATYPTNQDTGDLVISPRRAT